MSDLIPPHGKKEKLFPLIIKGEELKAELGKAEGLEKVRITSRETSDLIMMGIGAFTPLKGPMIKADWQGVCDRFELADGTFWPVPITISTDSEEIKTGDKIALVDDETNTLMATMEVHEKYRIEKEYECKTIFKTTDVKHPGVAKLISQSKYNIGGPVKILSESYYPEEFGNIYQRPEEARKIFENMGWRRIAALQLRNPMHRSHEYLAKIAIEIMDGIYIHQLIGRLKADDIPARIRVRAINVLLQNYFVKDTVVIGGYPMEMRYAGPREALLHAVFRQNFGCSHMIVGRDHAGVGGYYGPFDAQKIFGEVPKGALKCQSLNIDWTFHCYKCGGLASMRTCPHGKADRLLLSGTMVRKVLSEGGELPQEFSRPEVVEILKAYYQNLDKAKKVEIDLHDTTEGTSH